MYGQSYYAQKGSSGQPVDPMRPCASACFFRPTLYSSCTQFTECRSKGETISMSILSYSHTCHADYSAWVVRERAAAMMGPATVGPWALHGALLCLCTTAASVRHKATTNGRFQSNMVAHSITLYRPTHTKAEEQLTPNFLPSPS